MSNRYIEDTIEEFGVVHEWSNAEIKTVMTTNRGTKIEIIQRPKWGLACYMDNSIQSCEIDERIYHETLVHPALSSVVDRKRVMIIGGGEGATAREVLKWPGVDHVDMYEWDEDVVNLFKEKYPQWAQGAWSDPRLKIHFVDIFQAIKTPPTTDNKYDVIIIDLFEPCEENAEQWTILLNSINNWIKPQGSVVMYAGMRNILVKDRQPYQELVKIIQSNEIQGGVSIKDSSSSKEIIPYRVYIPSFSGESMFILLKQHTSQELNFEEAKKLNSHMTNDIWNSYKTLNW